MTADTSIQLYTLREEAAVDFRAVLARLGAIGYVGVELAGLNGLTPAELLSTLDDAGLTLSSAHVGLAKPDEYEAALDEHQALGCDTVVVPMLPPKAFADLDAIRIAADRINAANERARARGLTLGYHNHYWELPTVEVDPRSSILRSRRRDRARRSRHLLGASRWRRPRRAGTGSGASGAAP